MVAMPHRDDIDPERPERPRAEPEIIPPSRGGGREGASGIWISVDGNGNERIYVARPGPFSVILALLFTGIVIAAVVLVLLGVVLFWIPVAIFIIAALLLSGTIRYYWRRLQAWAAGR